MSNVARRNLGLSSAENQLRFVDLQSFNNRDVRLFPLLIEEGTQSGAGGGENGSPQCSGRQTGVVQSFPQIMGFLDKGRGAARTARASFSPTLGCFSEAQQGSRLEGRKETTNSFYRTRGLGQL